LWATKAAKATGGHPGQVDFAASGIIQHNLGTTDEQQCQANQRQDYRELSGDAARGRDMGACIGVAMFRQRRKSREAHRI
jgi:hypothetical protein